MKNLKDYYASILDACASDAEVGDYDDYGHNGCTIEEEDLYLEIGFSAYGRHTEDGDGYWLPRTVIISHVSVSVDEINGCRYTEDGDEIEIPDAELNELVAYIEKELPSMLED